jgi:hypothetical protein
MGIIGGKKLLFEWTDGTIYRLYRRFDFAFSQGIYYQKLI